ncbi:hypothetical protein predicted by Glimmer/Critica [Acetobacter senegalensis]|uniref:Uncharacterized protein n=1 Tax=Acetobacter senegalensis TaxID=446692 RepID=A0A0U5FL49_9PROT|nr:hypothetical protein predicted by Glimmer/Critica [Acetobacter senegalensis]
MIRNLAQARPERPFPSHKKKRRPIKGRRFLCREHYRLCRSKRSTHIRAVSSPWNGV